MNEKFYGVYVKDPLADLFWTVRLMVPNGTKLSKIFAVAENITLGGAVIGVKEYIDPPDDCNSFHLSVLPGMV